MERAPNHAGTIQPECRRMRTRCVGRSVGCPSLEDVCHLELGYVRSFAKQVAGCMHVYVCIARMCVYVCDLWRGVVFDHRKSRGKEERPVLHSASNELWTARCRGTSSGKKTRFLSFSLFLSRYARLKIRWRRRNKGYPSERGNTRIMRETDQWLEVPGTRRGEEAGSAFSRDVRR